MNTVEFFQAIWPKSGLLVLGTYPHKSPDGSRDIVHHHVQKNASDAAAFVGRMKTVTNVYHANHSFGALVNKVSAKGKPYRAVERSAANAHMARCFYVDLDVGPNVAGKDPKYPDQASAIRALAKFILDTGLPRPMVVSSGNGVHVYWIIDEDIPSAEWVPIAEQLKAITIHRGLLCDRTVTADAARILRPPGSLNLKDPEHPLLVATLAAQPSDIPLAYWRETINELAKGLPLPETPSGPVTFGGVPEEMPDPKDVVEVCGTFRRMLSEVRTQDEPHWYSMVQIIFHTLGGSKFAHKISSLHPGYNQAETQGKLDRLTASKMGPPRCSTLEGMYPKGESPCLSCAHHGLFNSSPVVIARRKPTIELPPEVPDPLPPFKRTKRGIEFQPLPTMDVPVPPAPRVICGVDIYPKQVVDDPVRKLKNTEWIAELPFKGPTSILLPIDAYTNPDKMTGILANQGVIVRSANSKLMGDFMSRYIEQLQEAQAEQTQVATFGWTKDFKQFNTPEGGITANGIVPIRLAAGTQNAALAIHKGGTMAGQVKALKFYSHPGYVRQQFMICLSLAAPLLHKTNHYGLLANMSGHSGASKTTTAWACGGLWAQPVRYVLNGTQGGMTHNARISRMHTLNSFPIVLDETTTMPAEQIKEMAMTVSQPGDRIRLTSAGVETVVPDSIKSTLMITTSNNSMHSLLSLYNSAGNAGSMRVFEVVMRALGLHTKAQADAFLAELNTHYGHIGPAFIEQVLKNDAVVDKMLAAIMADLETRAGIQPSERYWAVTIALAVLGATIAKAKGWLDYDAEAIMRWAIEEQIPAMRGVVSEAYLTPLGVLQDYLADVATDLLVLEPQVGTAKLHALRAPRSTTRGRFEQHSGKLWLSIGGFHAFCDKGKHNYDDVTRQLKAAGVMTSEKMDLARGVEGWTVGQARVLLVDVNHPQMTGLPAITDEEGSTVIPFKPKAVSK